MARYIDADALSHKFFEIGCHITKIHPMDVMNIISEQPTAYDVEKVEKELKLLLDLAKSALNSEIAISAGRRTFIQERYKGHIEMLEQVIDIVERGGV